MSRFAAFSLEKYLRALSSSEPTPGGGSASAYVACLGMGLGEMAAQIGMKKVGSESKSVVLKAIQLLRKTRQKALQVVDLDPKVYASVLKSYQKARHFSDQTKKARFIDEALGNSFRLQADLALLVVMAREAIQGIEGLIRGSIQNDLKVSRSFLEAAFRGAYDTAHINVVYLKDPQKRQRAESVLEELKKRFEINVVSKN